MKLTLRADAGPTTGAGHLIRCTALAQAAITAGDEALVVTEQLPAALAGLVESAGVPWSLRSAPKGSAEDARDTLEARGGQPDWVVADGYEFDSPFQAAIRSSGAHLLIMDDYFNDRGLDCTAILNPAGLDLARSYSSVAPAADRLLGPEYAVIRKEVVAARASPRDDASPLRVLLTMGASDPGGAVTVVLGALELVDLPMSVRVTAGPLRADNKPLIDHAASSRHHVEVVERADRIWRHMSWADVAISAGGSTCWELACLGLPMAILQTASNQEWVVRSLVAAEAATDVGAAGRLRPADLAVPLAALLANSARRRSMAMRGLDLVDGRGALRVLEYCRKRLGG